MASRSLQLMLCGLVIEVFAIVFALTFAMHIVAFFFGVLGLAVAAIGMRERDGES